MRTDVLRTMAATTRYAASWEIARVVISMSAPNWSPSLPETESTSPVGVRRVRT